MGASEENAGRRELDPAAMDRIVDLLHVGGADLPESRVLDAMVGRWTVHTDWRPVVGGRDRRSTSTMEAEWILDGRLLSCRQTAVDGDLTSILLVGYDRGHGDYAAFGPSALSTFFVVERGQYDPDRRLLSLEGSEPLPQLGRPVRYRRNIRFETDDSFVAYVEYPDVPPGTYGSMTITHRRIDGGEPPPR